MNLENISANRTASKRKAHNEFSVVTSLVKKYKQTNKEKDLLACLESLSGIVNTYTIMLSPSHPTQHIYITPYMKKFLGMFLTAEEKANCTNQTYIQALARVRWVIRQYDYEEIYTRVLEILIHTIKTMNVIGTCDCIYYIQLIVKYKLHSFVVNQSKDVTVNLIQSPISLNHNDTDDNNETSEEILDRISYSHARDMEDELINGMYLDLDINIITRKDDVFKCLTSYEKYLIYLKDYLKLSNRQMLLVLVHETLEELTDRFEDIEYKINLIMNEVN